MKKICFVTTIPMTVRAFVIPVVRHFAANTDWEITVVCDNDPTLQEELPAGVRYVPIPMKRGVSISGLLSIKELYQLFRREKFDLVQYSTPNAAFYASIASLLAGVKHRKYHLMGFRYLGFTGIKRYIFKTIERVSCFLSTDIECVSKSNMELGLQEKVFPYKKSKVIFYGSSAGVDLDRFDIRRKQDWRNKIRKCLGYSDDQCVFGFAGRITGDKGINELLEAFFTLPHKQNRLLLVGEVEMTGLNSALFEKAEKDPRILIHPFVDDIERYFAGMDVLVLPSYREGFGNIVIEAQAMGVPVIVTDIPGPTDAVERGVSGLVVPAGNVNELTQVMNRLSEDEPLRYRLGAQGRKLVEERFDSKILMEYFLKERKALLDE